MDIIIRYIIISISTIKIFSKSKYKEVALLEQKAYSIYRVYNKSLSKGAINSVNYIIETIIKTFLFTQKEGSINFPFITKYTKVN